MAYGPTNTFHSKVNGTSWRENIPWDMMSPGDKLTPKLDPYGNTVKLPHSDPYAIALFFEDSFIGYVPKETAKDLAPKIYNDEIDVEITISELTGGTAEKKNRGINTLIKTQYKTLEYLNKYNPFSNDDGLESPRDSYLI